MRFFFFPPARLKISIPPPSTSLSLSPLQDCITAHGADAHFIAREFYGTASVIKPTGGLPCVALSRPTYEAAVRALRGQNNGSGFIDDSRVFHSVSPLLGY